MEVIRKQGDTLAQWIIPLRQRWKKRDCINQLDGGPGAGRNYFSWNINNPACVICIRYPIHEYTMCGSGPY